MATVTESSSATSPVQVQEPAEVPPLENGDRLTGAEFLRRYDAMPDLKKAELIEGIVYMGSPVSYHHCSPHFDLVSWLGYYRMSTPGIVGGDNGTVRLDLDNIPQPDAFLRIPAEAGGQSRLGADGYIAGAPELVAEVSNSTASYDTHAKKTVYRRNGVREYLIWRTRERAVDWFILRDGEYARLEPTADGLHHSAIFPGLWLDAGALIRGDTEALLRATQAGLASPGHAAFLERLKDPGDGPIPQGG